jgi:hypothetical protein
MITSDSLAKAKRLVDQGVSSDGRFPTNPVILIKSSDPARNIRSAAFDNAIFDARIRGGYSIMRTNSISSSGHTGLLGMQTGAANFSVSAGTFIPGAMADSMTSFGGIIFGPNGQTSLLAFINAGASGSYGTVAEPSANTSRFPSPQAYFYQARGFSIAECYYQSLKDPHLGLIVAEPLAAPFAQTGSGRWTGVSHGSVLSGRTNLSLEFSAADPTRPIRQVDLFVDGVYFRTLTNLAPEAGNVLELTVNGTPMNYIVPEGSTLTSIAADLASDINSLANIGDLRAEAHGDRIEVRALSATTIERPVAPRRLRLTPTSDTTDEAAAWAGSGPMFAETAKGTGRHLTTHVRAERSALVASPACGVRTYTVGGTIQVGTWLSVSIMRTNGVRSTVAVTNHSSEATLFDVCKHLVDRVNGATELMGAAGVTAEDLRNLWLGSLTFTLRARSPGIEASGIRIRISGSPDLVVSPTSEAVLQDNASDLQPRNHFYVAAGVHELRFAFPFDTAGLADGHHLLTAVAYEGSHLRTQTHASVPVVIRNSSLSATLVLNTTNETVRLSSLCSARVEATATDVKVISLHSTGGEIGRIDNSQTATFDVPGTVLGVGLHPLYALVETGSGDKYRTGIRWIRFTP